MSDSKDDFSSIQLPDIVKDLLAGTVASMVGMWICHPLDTIRIRMQIQTYPRMYDTMFHCGIKAIQREGLGGLFKGVFSNALGSTPIYSLCFASKEFCAKILRPYNISEGSNSYISG